MEMGEGVDACGLELRMSESDSSLRTKREELRFLLLEVEDDDATLLNAILRLAWLLVSICLREEDRCDDEVVKDDGEKAAKYVQDDARTRNAVAVVNLIMLLLLLIL